MNATVYAIYTERKRAREKVRKSVRERERAIYIVRERGLLLNTNLVKEYLCKHMCVCVFYCTALVFVSCFE